MNKEIVSVRFGGKDASRITETEWDAFSRLADYFKISESSLVEAAMRYAQCGHEPVVMHYFFNAETFSHYGGAHDGLQCLLPSLQNGRLEKKVVISAGNLNMMIPEGSLIRYDPPYIVRFEPDKNMRIHLDLTEDFQIADHEKNITIHC